MGWTPLHAAAVAGDAETVKKLLDAGAQVNAKTNTGRTPLHVVALSGKAEGVTAPQGGGGYQCEGQGWLDAPVDEAEEAHPSVKGMLQEASRSWANRAKGQKLPPEGGQTR